MHSHRRMRALARALFALLLVASPSALAAPPGAVPVSCYTGVGAGFESNLFCLRADTRASFTEVPEGLFLHVTDIHITRNSSASEGSFAALIGRDDLDDFPTSPRLDITGYPIGVYAINFTTPYIVLHGGEILAVANFESSDFPIDVYVGGYLAAVVAP